MSIVRSRVSIKQWTQSLLSVAKMRPSHCPSCRAPSQPFGEPLCLVGHGVRDRIVRGPLDLDSLAPALRTCVSCRRYRCLACSAVMLVVPAGVLPRRHFFGPAIALALFLLGAGETPIDEVRRTIGGTTPFQDAIPNVWRTLSIWTHAAAAGKIFSRIATISHIGCLRAAATAVASALAGYAKMEAGERSMSRLVFSGAGHAI